jgi:hypothetical protein
LPLAENFSASERLQGDTTSIYPEFPDHQLVAETARNAAFEPGNSMLHRNMIRSLLITLNFVN